MSSTVVPSTPTQPFHDPVPRRRVRFWWIASCLVVCGAICAFVGAMLFVHHKIDNRASSLVSAFVQTPALELKIHFLRDSMKYHGQDTVIAHVFPHQIDSTGQVQFDAVVRLEHENTVETYSIIGEQAFSTVTSDGSSTSKCLKPSQVPPLHLIQSTISTARVIDAAEVGTEAISVCQDGERMLQIEFAGEKYILCTTSTGQVTYARSSDLEITIEYLASTRNIAPLEAPLSSDGTSINCESFKTSTSPEVVTSWGEIGSQAMEVLSATTRTGSLERTNCGCKSEKKPCLFVHGLANPFNMPLSNTFILWWGLIHLHSPCCSSIKFTHFDTINQPWHSDKLQQDFCNAALQVSNSNDTKTVRKLILVSHSMGNLIASGALATGKCAFSDQVTWISLAGPMRGSKSADLFNDICHHDLLEKPLTALHLCPPAGSLSSMYYYNNTGAIAQARYDAAQRVRRAHVYKTICGTDPWGINTIFSAPFKLVGDLSKHGDANDGLVSVESCTAGIGMDGFGSTTDSFNYLSAVNHLDCSFREGDGWWGAARKPVKWFECAL